MFLCEWIMNRRTMRDRRHSIRCLRKISRVWTSTWSWVLVVAWDLEKSAKSPGDKAIDKDWVDLEESAKSPEDKAIDKDFDRRRSWENESACQWLRHTACRSFKYVANLKRLRLSHDYVSASSKISYAVSISSFAFTLSSTSSESFFFDEKPNQDWAENSNLAHERFKLY